ncbi:DMT family transporter [Grimontia sp. NTOU-MAR1]|uniref:DMT family transporter n=1 Tax=Grimontia sp. NTOU-MAR1 TaxID=3111011 RepID=UPI002DB97235|nr:DMT family transporter [Grimontia sp. NTOU-MAR1]WRW01099.1 DMT family transporter [Grimontia sp. NTOU-MAR1]
MVKAILWMSGTLLSFCLMAVGARELSGEIHTSQVMLFRSVLGLLVICSILLITQNNRGFLTKRIGLHGLRNTFHFAGQYGWLLGITVLPLAEVFALEFTVPLWTAMIAWLFLGESITARKLAAIGLGLAGVLVILKPSVEVFNWYSLIVLAAAFCYAISHASTKSLSNTESPLTILFFMCLIQLPIGFVFALSDWSTPAGMQWIWLMIVGLTALSAHFCMTKAMQYAEVSTVVILDFLRLPAIGMVGALAYGESVEVSLFVGALIMLFGNLLMMLKEVSRKYEAV